jgi:hypothetical protein
MLSHHLKSALSDLKDIITITESDIADIKEAKNDTQFERLSLKEEKIKSFVSNYAMIDHVISCLMRCSAILVLAEVLNQEQL